MMGRNEGTARIEPPVQATADTSGTKSPQGWMVDIGAGGQSRVKNLPVASGRTAARHATVFACCNNIAGDHAKVPLKLYQRDENGVEVRVRDHPATYLLNVEASMGVSAIGLRFSLAYAFLLRGRSYGYAPRDAGGEITLIEAISPDLCTELAAGRSRYYEFEDGAGVRRRVPNRSMVHMRYMAEDGWTGRSPIEVASESIGLALARQEAAARMAAGGATRGVIKMADVFEDEEDWTRNAKRIRNAMADPEGKGWPIIGTEEDIIPLDMSASDQQLLEGQKFDREMIAAIYRMPPSKLQMLEHGVKANGQQQAIDYRSDCLLHWGKFIEAQYDLGILTEAERRAKMFFRHDYNTLLQATTKERYEAFGKAVGGPIMTPNEARKKEGLPDVAGGDKLNPAPNMTRDDSGDDQKDDDDE
ncbi:phage portal protein [Marinosulfonomonas sp. PRT-SC04]|nr:phage portal protein [Marinosulfonomonas sp. PRT-SC04]